jgi:hypothetical protein
MNAKHLSVPLYVRIPASLKRNLALMARIRRTSMSAQIARILEEQSPTFVATDLKLQSTELQLNLCKKMLEMMERVISHSASKLTASTGVLQLKQLAEQILKQKKERELKLKDIRHRLETPKTRRVSSSPSLHIGFNMHPDVDMIPRQLEVCERRRHNLCAAISSRPRGTKAQLAVALKCTPPYLSQMLSPPGSRGHRNISAEVARKLEQALRLKKGELDRIEPKLAIVELNHAISELTKVNKTLGR